MNDRHEHSRAAFEAEAESELFSTMRDSHGQYLAALTSVMWQAWCRALDYAAEQQAAPTPLTRPDRPGWWWVWNDASEEWEPLLVCDFDGYLMGVGQVHLWEAIWRPATPPPAPTGKEGVE